MTEDSMKGVLQLALEPPAGDIPGGFVYFAAESQARDFQSRGEWVEAFKKQGVMALDPKGLTALLVALKMHHDAEKVHQAFQAGVQTTQALVGQADQMAAALGNMNAASLRSRIAMDGGVLTPMGREESKTEKGI